MGRKWPYALAFATCFIKGSASDGIAQTKLENAATMDWKRNTRFATWSAGYCGMFQHWIYNILYARLFPSASVMSRIACTACDCSIHGPLVYLPTYYVCKSLMTGGSAKDGFDEWWINKWDISKAYWKVWIPTVFVMMFFIPFEFRVLTLSVVSLFWLVIVSYMAPMVDNEKNEDQLVKEKQMDT